MFERDPYSGHMSEIQPLPQFPPQRAPQHDQQREQQRMGERMDDSCDDMPTVPIPARKVVTTFDAASRHERLEVKPPLTRLFRRTITKAFSVWLKFSTALVRSLDWYPRVEPYVGYGTEHYSRLICRTVYGPFKRQAGRLIRGIRGMLMVPSPHTKVRIAIDDVPIETVQVGASEVYDAIDSNPDISSEFAASDDSGYLDLVAEHSLEPGIHNVSYKVRSRKPVNANLFTIPSGTKVGVISDVDDTIMVTQAPRLMKAAYNLLLLNPRKKVPVASMNLLFNRIADMFPDAPFFYLSTSPWNVESSIRHFITNHGFPEGPLLLRDLDRFADATARMASQCPLGSGALAGTTYPLDRDFTAEKLGFAAPCANSLDGVSDRDFCIELASAISICMMHLSRLSEEIILWCSWEFKFIELDDAFTTGSSIMPQKKNPDVTELIRGKTGRVYGDLNTLLVMMKGIPLAYNKDMQEDKEAVFDAVDTLELCLKTITPMLATMTPLPANMRRAAAKGFINATDCADYLTKKGMPFRDAYKCTGTMVGACIRADKTLEELTLDEFKQYSDLFEADIYDAIDLTHCCEGRTSYGGPTQASVLKQIADVKSKINC